MEDCLNAYREGAYSDRLGRLPDGLCVRAARARRHDRRAVEQADLGTRLTASAHSACPEQLTARFVTDGAPIASIRVAADLLRRRLRLHAVR